jgi:hypothetical protein
LRPAGTSGSSIAICALPAAHRRLGSGSRSGRAVTTLFSAVTVTRLSSPPFGSGLVDSSCARRRRRRPAEGSACAGPLAGSLRDGRGRAYPLEGSIDVERPTPKSSVSSAWVYVPRSCGSSRCLAWFGFSGPGDDPPRIAIGGANEEGSGGSSTARTATAGGSTSSSSPTRCSTTAPCCANGDAGRGQLGWTPLLTATGGPANLNMSRKPMSSGPTSPALTGRSPHPGAACD